MAQNTSSAVMQQRREPKDALDDFPTPPWATRALCNWLRTWTVMDTCREPAANRGHMVRPLREYFRQVEASDVHDYGAGFPVFDFIGMEKLPPVDWTITNPPFRLAEAFIERALETSLQGVAMLVRTAFLEGVGRHERLFKQRPPSYILQFSERVVMHKGRLSPDGSTATAYCWVIWTHDFDPQWGTRFGWVRPCRKQLEAPGDYPEDPGLQ